MALSRTSHDVPGTSNPLDTIDIQGLLRLYLCPPRGRDAADSSVGEIRACRYAMFRKDNVNTRHLNVERLPSFQGAWRVEVMLSLAHPFVLQSKTVRQRQRERATLCGSGNAWAPGVCCTCCVFGCGARQVRADAGLLCLYSQRAARSPLLLVTTCKLVVLSISSLMEHSSKSC